MESQSLRFDRRDALRVSQWINRIVNDDIMDRVDRMGSVSEKNNEAVHRLFQFGDGLSWRIVGPVMDSLNENDIEAGKGREAVVDAVDNAIEFLRSEHGSDIRSDSLVNELADLSSGLRHDPEYRAEAEVEFDNRLAQADGLTPGMGKHESLLAQVRRASERAIIFDLHDTINDRSGTPASQLVGKAIDSAVAIRRKMEGSILNAKANEGRLNQKLDHGLLTGDEFHDKVKENDRNMREEITNTLMYARKDGNPSVGPFFSQLKSMSDSLDYYEWELEGRVESMNVIDLSAEMPLKGEMPDPKDPGGKGRNKGPSSSGPGM